MEKSSEGVKRSAPASARPKSSDLRKSTGAHGIKEGRLQSSESLSPYVDGLSLQHSDATKSELDDDSSTLTTGGVPTTDATKTPDIAASNSSAPTSRASLPPNLQKNREKVEKMKEEVSDKWSGMDPQEKLIWWRCVLELLEGEIEIEKYWFPINELEEKFNNDWKKSKDAQQRKYSGWKERAGTHFTKDDATLFALDRCFEAYNNGHIVYFFKYTLQDDPKDFVKYTDEASGKEFKVGILAREHTAQSQSNQRMPFFCVNTPGQKTWGGRRFTVYELKACGEKFDANKHKVDHDLNIFGVFVGDPGAYKFEFEMTVVGRLFFPDFQCMNQSYMGIPRFSCVDKEYPGLHGCGSITYHTKKGLANMNLAINERYAKYDRAKFGGALLPYSYERVSVIPTRKQIRNLKRRKNISVDEQEAFEDAVANAPSYEVYHWNLMADRLQLLATMCGWKKGPNGNKGIRNMVDKDQCRGEDYSDSDESDSRAPYLWVWWRIMMGLTKRNGKFYTLTDEQKKRLETIGMSFHKEDIKVISDTLNAEGKRGVQGLLENTFGGKSELMNDLFGEPR